MLYVEGGTSTVRLGAILYCNTRARRPRCTTLVQREQICYMHGVLTYVYCMYVLDTACMTRLTTADV